MPFAITLTFPNNVLNVTSLLHMLSVSIVWGNGLNFAGLDFSHSIGFNFVATDNISPYGDVLSVRVASE